MHTDSNDFDPIVRAISGSLAMRFGSNAPHTLPRVFVGHDGVYASNGSDVIVVMHCRERDISLHVPMARQAVFRAFGEAGLPTGGIELRPTVSAPWRTRILVDENESSPSFGRRKRMVEVVYRFALDRATRRLLTREEAQAYRTSLVPAHARDVPDVLVSNEGSVFLFRPVSEAAVEWIEENVSEDAQFFGDALAVEARYASDLAAGMIDADLRLR